MSPQRMTRPSMPSLRRTTVSTGCVGATLNRSTIGSLDSGTWTSSRSSPARSWDSVGVTVYLPHMASSLGTVPVDAQAGRGRGRAAVAALAAAPAARAGDEFPRPDLTIGKAGPNAERGARALEAARSAVER